MQPMAGQLSPHRAGNKAMPLKVSGAPSGSSNGITNQLALNAGGGGGGGLEEI